jgi:hypothetical protein
MNRILIVALIIVSGFVVAIPTQAQASSDGSLLSIIGSWFKPLSVPATDDASAAVSGSIAPLIRVSAIVDVVIRDRAATRSKVVGTVKAGTIGTVMDSLTTKTGVWKKVAFDSGITGWTPNAYLQLYTGTLATPTGFNAYVQAAGWVFLSWSDLPATSGLAKYNIYRSIFPATPTLYASEGVANRQEYDLDPALTYAYQVSAVDVAGRESPKSEPIYVKPADTTPPFVLVYQPSHGNIISGTAAPITLSVGDNYGMGIVLGAKVNINGVLSSPVIAEWPYTYYWDTTKVPNGGYMLSGTAWDAWGNYATSSQIWVEVQN